MRSFIHVKFKETDKKDYVYIADGSVDELSEFTHAVVDSPYGALTVTRVHKVAAIDESTYEGSYKHVVALFDIKPYDDAVAREDRKRALDKALRQRVAQRSLIQNYEKLLEGDEEGLKLLQEFKQL